MGGIRIQGERLYEVFSELIRAYQSRDREQANCWGLSDSQCYALEGLLLHGPMTMGELASRLFVDASTVTRTIDRLAEADLVERELCRDDRRVCRAAITASGRDLITRVRDYRIGEHVQVLEAVPEDHRETVIAAFQGLLDAFRACEIRGDRDHRSQAPPVGRSDNSS